MFVNNKLSSLLECIMWKGVNHYHLYKNFVLER